eukprot:CAMPEP_0170490966 /NCGR_PEP_ID=MMETSP0208-20121228/10108_1 /TAXON_ID=197538 /ORGANISM="Strombidium inclinatum, Strain S3" /LENGTH=111 /DNA_ID=CAMNT_0010766461 /DNA_START=436 /DNA_END=768 /DNA_ORIENTATION=+
MLLVNPLVEGQVLVFDVEELVCVVEQSVFNEDAEEDLEEDFPVAWELVGIKVPPQFPAIDPHAEHHRGVVDDGCVKEELSEGRVHLLSPAFRVLLPGPGLVFLDLELFKEW